MRTPRLDFDDSSVLTFVGSHTLGEGKMAISSPPGPDLSIVVVSFNGRDLLRACLTAVFETVTEHRFEIVVIDNASADGSVEMMTREFPTVRVLASDRNVGFARANNRALAETKGRNLLLLNPDAVPRRGAIDAMVRHLDANPRVGVVAPRLLNPDLSDQGTARAFPTAAAFVFGRRSPLTRLFPRNPWSRAYLIGRDRTGDDPFEVDWVSGACLMLRRAVLDQVGGLDESFFMYWEDADWCRRIKRAGHQIVCVAAARVVHFEGSSRRRPARQVWVFHRSVYRYYRKQRRVALRIIDPLVFGALAIRAVSIIAATAVGGALRSAPRPAWKH
jgi:hypothetical protein